MLLKELGEKLKDATIFLPLAEHVIEDDSASSTHGLLRDEVQATEEPTTSALHSKGGSDPGSHGLLEDEVQVAEEHSTKRRRLRQVIEEPESAAGEARQSKGKTNPKQ